MTCFPNGEEEARRGRQRLLSLMESCTGRISPNFFCSQWLINLIFSAALYTPADLLGNAEENVTDDKLSEPEDGPVFKFDDVAEALPNLMY